MVHMLGDMITSAGVIVAALIICYNPEWKIADPICTFLFSVMVIHTTLPTMQEGFSVLLEAAPEDINTVEVFNALNEVSTFRFKSQPFLYFSLMLLMKSMISTCGRSQLPFLYFQLTLFPSTHPRSPSSKLLSFSRTSSISTTQPFKSSQTRPNLKSDKVQPPWRIALTNSTLRTTTNELAYEQFIANETGNNKESEQSKQIRS